MIGLYLLLFSVCEVKKASGKFAGCLGTLGKIAKLCTLKLTKLTKKRAQDFVATTLLMLVFFTEVSEAQILCGFF